VLEPRVRPFKSRAAVLQALKDFFTLRPVVTLSLLRVIWSVYVIAQGWRFLAFLWGLHASNAVQTITWAQWASVMGSAVYPLLNVLLARVLIEVAAVVLLGHAYAHPEQRERSQI